MVDVLCVKTLLLITWATGCGLGAYTAVVMILVSLERRQTEREKYKREIKGKKLCENNSVNIMMLQTLCRMTLTASRWRGRSGRRKYN